MLPKKQTVIKFVLLCALLVGYFTYLSLKFDVATGGVVAALTWSFFVLCTPIADAGFLLDFPLRLLFGVRMVMSELAVWAVAISLNASVLYFAPHYYDTTLLMRVFHQILMNPFPYWGVIVLSVAGTFLSIRFADETMDVLHHRDRNFFHSHQFKHELIMIGFFVLVLIGYYELIASLGIDQVIQSSE